MANILSARNQEQGPCLESTEEGLQATYEAKLREYNEHHRAEAGLLIVLMALVALLPWLDVVYQHFTHRPVDGMRSPFLRRMATSKRLDVEALERMSSAKTLATRSAPPLLHSGVSSLREWWELMGIELVLMGMVGLTLGIGMFLMGYAQTGDISYSALFFLLSLFCVGVSLRWLCWFPQLLLSMREQTFQSLNRAGSTRRRLDVEECSCKLAAQRVWGAMMAVYNTYKSFFGMGGSHYYTKQFAVE